MFYTQTTWKEHIGRCTWTLLHNIVNGLSDDPLKDEINNLKYFIYSLSKLYPCVSCKINLQADLTKLPVPDSGTKADYIKWMCKLHNVTNERLGKTLVDC